MSKIYNSKEAAEYLGISYYYLRNLRQGLHPHEGPKCAYIGNLGRGKGHFCAYKKEDLDSWKAKWKPRKALLKPKGGTL